MGADLSDVSEITLKLESWIDQSLKFSQSDFDAFIFVFDLYPEKSELYEGTREKLTVSKKQRTIFCNARCSSEEFNQLQGNSERFELLRKSMSLAILREEKKLVKLGITATSPIFAENRN